jgi:hypothetical protein
VSKYPLDVRAALGTRTDSSSMPSLTVAQATLAVAICAPRTDVPSEARPRRTTALQCSPSPVFGRYSPSIFPLLTLGSQDRLRRHIRDLTHQKAFPTQWELRSSVKVWLLANEVSTRLEEAKLGIAKIQRRILSPIRASRASWTSSCPRCDKKSLGKSCLTCLDRCR